MRDGCVLTTLADVERCLTTYADWWQPASSSILLVGGARRNSEIGDGLSPGVLETLDERTELIRRVALLEERDRRLLVLWYIAQHPVRVIARHIGVSPRQVFRRRARAIRRIVELGEDVSEAAAS